VIATHRAEERRIDRQLIGRCARQGDPGSYETLAALEDENLPFRKDGRLFQLLMRCTESGIVAGRLLSPLLSAAQWAEERKQRLVRRRLMDLEDYLDELLGFSGQPE
jgi:preprotein translocase subunit SecA